jgi:hypothetical protein
MKRFLPALVFILFATQVLAQNSNNWIQFNQQYFKIPVAKEGLYRIAYADLVAAGFPATSDPKNIQLFHRGVQQAIIVAGESDGEFNTSDFIEFYGRPNDGKSDTELYVHPTAQPHTYHNLYSDTTSYFLTVAGVSGKRIPLYDQVPMGSAESFHWDEKLLVQKSQYSTGIDYGNVQQTVFDNGEGWTGVQILQNQSVVYTITGISGQVTSAGQPKLEVLLTGRGGMDHQAEIHVGSRLVATVSFSKFESYKHTQSVEWSDISSDGKLPVTIKVIGVNGMPDRLSAGYIKLLYPQQLNMANETQKVFQLNENPSGQSRLQIANAPAGVRLFDVTDPSSVIALATVQTTSLEAMVNNTEASRKILATNNVLTAVVKPVSFRQITPGAQDFVIISHPLLRRSAGGYSDPVQAYGAYRASSEGGGYDTLVVNIQQLYDQFNYGEQSPLAIFHFMQYLATDDLPMYLMLIGKGLQVNYSYYRNPAPFTIYKDLVPTAGYPGSDIAFTAGLNGTTYGPAVATGRLSANTAEDVAAYLNKLKETEARPFDDLRRKNMLHLSGGIEEHEPQQFKIFMEEFQQISESFYFGAKVTPMAKQSTDLRLVNIADEVNKGLGMVTFFGHSAPTTQDFDIGYVTNPVLGYNNAGKYPVFMMNGCDAGATFLNTLITSENWVNAANKGAIGFIAHSSYGLVFSLKNYSDTFYKIAFGDSVYLNKGIGEVQQELARRYLDQYGEIPINISQVQQMVLQGDPALRIFGATKPDYEVKEGNVSISSFDGEGSLH